MFISATAVNVRQALAAARREAGLKLNDSREELRSGGEDGLYRVHLAGGHIVECTIRPRTAGSAEIILA